MEKNIEREIKNLLTKREYRLLYNYMMENYKFNGKVVNYNYYIDSKEKDLFSQGIKVRIRKVDNSIILLSIKQAKSNLISNTSKQKVALNLELEMGLNKEDTNLLLVDESRLNRVLKKILSEKFPNAKFGYLMVLGSMKTERTFFKINSKYGVVNLDLNYYFSEIDYEFEWETNLIDEALIITDKIFRLLGVKWKKTFSSKTSRVISRV